MPDRLSDQMSRLPSALPAVDWASAAQLRRIGQRRRRRRLAAAALGVVLAMSVGTGLGYRLLRPTSLPVVPAGPPVIQVPTGPSPSPPPSPTPRPVPASAMLRDADLPAGYQVTDQVAHPAGESTVVNGRTNPEFTPDCADLVGVLTEFGRLDRDLRYHSYFVGQDLSTPRIAETVIRYASPESARAAVSMARQLAIHCGPVGGAAEPWFGVTVDGTDASGNRRTEYWTVAVAPESDLLAFVRSSVRLDDIGATAIQRLSS